MHQVTPADQPTEDDVLVYASRSEEQYRRPDGTRFYTQVQEVKKVDRVHRFRKH